MNCRNFLLYSPTLVNVIQPSVRIAYAHSFLLLCAITLNVSPSVCAEPIVTTDMLRIKSIPAIDVARPGTHAVFILRSIHEEPPAENADSPSYTYRQHVYLLPLADADAEARQLTFGDRHDAQPVLSPKGRHVAFVRSDGEDDSTSQVWVMPLDGGEAQQVTHLEHGATRPRWSPDGTSLLVQSSVPMSDLDGNAPWPGERPGKSDASPVITPRPDGNRAEIRAWLARNAEADNPRVYWRLKFQGELDLRKEERITHLFAVDPFLSAAQAVQISDGFFNHRQAEFTADGNGIVYVSNKNATMHPDRMERTDLWIMDADGSNDRQFLSIDGWRLEQPKPSGDGSVIAFFGQQVDQPAYRPNIIGLAAADGSDYDWLTADADIHTWSGTWFDAKGMFLFQAEHRGGYPLMAVGQGLIRPEFFVEKHNDWPVGIHAFDAGGATLVYSACTPDNPCVLKVRDANGDRVVFDANQWVADKQLSKPSEGFTTTLDGKQIQYWVMPPTKFNAGRRYPIALEIHGGPSAMWGPGEFTMWHEFQLLCSWGYTVVYANPRGSGGYGYDFVRANFQDWGRGPMSDVQAALDQAISEHPWMDPDRMVVTGGSYGGYLTSWLICFDHRFKAAVAQRGVYDLATFFGEGNAWQLVEWEFGGMPFDARYRDVIRDNSPFNFAQRIRTPLLIMHADNDLRTGVSQSEMLYRSLKSLKKPVEYVRYPVEGHELSRSGDPLRRMDRLNRMIEFFERFVDNPQPAPTAKRLSHTLNALETATMHSGAASEHGRTP